MPHYLNEVWDNQLPQGTKNDEVEELLLKMSDLSYSLRKHMRPVPLVLIFHTRQLFEAPGQFNLMQPTVPDNTNAKTKAKFNWTSPPFNIIFGLGPLLQLESFCTHQLYFCFSSHTQRKYQRIVKQKKKMTTWQWTKDVSALLLWSCLS